MTWEDQPAIPAERPVDHDLDHVERLLVRYRDCAPGSAGRCYAAEQIVEQILMEQWLSELRCLRNRPLAPCPDPVGHTHARDPI
jgi:hypothetical protein